MNEIILVHSCEYWTRYAGPNGDSDRPTICEESAKLRLANSAVRPMICVCRKHADRIVERFPELGDIQQRFIPV